MQLHNLAERKKMPRYKVYNLCAERNLYAPSRVSKCGHLELCPCTPEVTPAKAFCGTVREHVQVGSGVERQKLAHPSSVRAAPCLRL